MKKNLKKKHNKLQINNDKPVGGEPRKAFWHGEMPPSNTQKNVPAEATKADAPKADATKAKAKKTADGQKIVRKRGPPRPHRKLAQDVLEKRINKLQRRIERVQTQLDDAQRHIVGYRNEEQYRKDHPEEAPQATQVS